MKIDPNRDIGYQAAYILCEAGRVVLHDGSASPQKELEEEAGAFMTFCRSLDPNTFFIVALIPDEADKAVFFRAREVANQIGLHMQAPVETAMALRSQWEAYRRMKQLPVS